MDNNQEKSGFTYTYSAKEQAELRRIRDKYTAPTETESKIDRLRRLDASVTRAAMSVSLVFGIIGTLIMGFGMSLCMTDIGLALGLGMDIAMLLGILVAIVGAIVAAVAYPIYNAIVRSKRKKIAPEIIRLADELIK